MMDMNVTDHDAFSKLSLNWVKPYVVTGDSKITHQSGRKQWRLHPHSSQKEAPGMAPAFDEYMLLELYTPTGLNQLDSGHQIFL
jgi:hypothetical protein